MCCRRSMRSWTRFAPCGRGPVTRGFALARLLSRTARVCVGIAVMGALAPAAGVSAQEAPAASVSFTGQVVDTYWGKPVEGAVLRVRGAMRRDSTVIVGVTDAAGHFDIERVPPGPSQVEVTRIGYADLIQVLDIQAGQFVEVAVIPKPVVLEGIEVYVDRLKARLRALPHIVDTYEQAALGAAPDLNVASYLDSQPGFAFVPCFEGAASSSGAVRRAPDCMRTRGTLVERPRIFIDDAPAFGGIPELATLPTTEVYRVEVIRGCAQIRIYTVTYTEETAVRRRPLVPIIC